MSLGVGLRAFTDALSLAREPGIARFIWWPALISLVVIGSSLGLLFSQVDAGVAWILSHLPSWLSFLEWILAPLAYVLGVLVGALLFSYAATLIASPFLGLLSARVQRHVTGTDPTSGLGVLATIPAALGRELRKLVYHLPRALLVFLLTLLPVVNLVAPVIWFAFGAWIMAVQFGDYAPENEDVDFRTTLATLKQHRAAALGFGAPAALAMAIPLINVVAVPVAVIGGTLLWCRLRQMGQPVVR